MQKYIALAIAGLLIVVALVAGYVHIIPGPEVGQIIQLVIAYILGHATSIGILHYAEYLDRKGKR